MSVFARLLECIPIDRLAGRVTRVHRHTDAPEQEEPERVDLSNLLIPDGRPYTPNNELTMEHLNRAIRFVAKKSGQSRLLVAEELAKAEGYESFEEMKAHLPKK